MGYLSRTIFSGPGLPSIDNRPLPLNPRLPEPPQSLDPRHLMSNLRQAQAAGRQPPASVLHEAADVARVLTGASGVAIAVRTKGIVVCRARSGDIAPELGAALDVDSGISGECLRTANILLCNDAESDSRVDPEVCRALGIRSIAAVPLRGPMGMAGILEAFSTNPSAFGDEQIDYLRVAAEIAEVAYERECRARNAAQVSGKSAIRRQLFSPLTISDQSLGGRIFDEPLAKRRYWILGTSVIASLLIFGVLWLSWHDPTPDVAASEPTAQTLNAAEGRSAATPADTAPAKPEAGIGSRQPRQLRTSVLQNAAEIDPAKEGPGSTVAAGILSPYKGAAAKVESMSTSSESEPPPAVELAASEAPSLLSGLASGAVTLPALEARVSQGVTQPELIHKVPLVYPSQARILRLAGSVTLDATVGRDGAVREIKLVSGEPLLAAAATEAVRQWRYSPPLLNGTPIEVHKQITIVFKLP